MGYIKCNRLAIPTSLLQSLKSLPYEKNYYLKSWCKSTAKLLDGNKK